MVSPKAAKNILTIDTSLNKGYITFNGASKVIESDAMNYHSAYLVGEIKKILNGQKPEVIGVDAGPGSFTGIRVGVTVARVMGQQLKCKVVPVSSCEILSEANNRSIVIMDARRGMYYFCHEEKITLISRAEIELIPPQRVICDNSSLDMLKGFGFDARSYEKENLPLGETLARLTEEKLQSEEEFSWASVKPLYIQTPPIFGQK